MEIRFTTGESPLGTVLVATTDKGICAVSLREQPSQLATGVSYVFVNGVSVVDNGRVTVALPGRALRGPGYAVKH